MRIAKYQLLLIVILSLASILRLWKIDQVPVSLFGDELDVGYHAYSILHTGKDYSGNPWPLHFQSLAEWRTPLYLYSSVPTVAMFGISPLGVRLPAAIFGIFGVLLMYMLVKLWSKNEILSLGAAAVLALSPWHIQYSRAGFEVTQLLFFLLLGLYLFYKSLNTGKWLWASVASFCLMPWVYSTGKLFTPMILVFLFIIYGKKIIGYKSKYLFVSVLTGLIIGGPIAYSTIFGGGVDRFNYISVFSDPTTEPEVAMARQNDARVRGALDEGLNPTAFERLLHNKYTYWSSIIGRNYIQSFSFDFLFNEGDPNLRHSIEYVGQFYKPELLLLVIGAVIFFASFKDRRIKLLVAFWLIAGAIPSSVTRDGGNHATRLILILPPLVILIAYGLNQLVSTKSKSLALLVSGGYLLVFVTSFIFYQHAYWVHNPWNTERWWHYGFKQTVQEIKKVEQNYEKVIISTANEPPWIFFAAWYQYPPDKWQAGFPMKKALIQGFGEISFIDKYYFGSPSVGGLYDWGKVMDFETLYVATSKEINVNLIKEPHRLPQELQLISAIAYPSGEPAFYLLARKI